MDALAPEPGSALAALTIEERTGYLTYLIRCVNALSQDMVRRGGLQLISIRMWQDMPPALLVAKLRAHPDLEKRWKRTQRRDGQLSEDGLEASGRAATFLQRLCLRFFYDLETIPAEGGVDRATVAYCERFLELIIDLEAQLPTRRFFNALLDAMLFVPCCRLSVLAKREAEGRLFVQLLDMVQYYALRDQRHHGRG